MFKLHTPYKITDPQKQAADKLVKGLREKKRHQTLLGVTGCGKTLVMAKAIEKAAMPALVISPNKTLGAQLYEEFKGFFPDNAVHYFVSYYDYYQPEAYIPQTDVYIKKDAQINKEIDRLRHLAIQDLFRRQDVVVVASVSAIYNIGSPFIYQHYKFSLERGQEISKRELMERLLDLQYERNDYQFEPGKFRVRADFLDVWQSGGEHIFRVKVTGNKISRIKKIKAPFGTEENADSAVLWPAKFWLSEKGKLNVALSNIRLELQKRTKELTKQGKVLEAERLRRRTLYDISLIRETGWCPGIENYSQHLEFRKPNEPPYSLLDYFIHQYEDYLLLLDESHMGVPQLRGMYEGDRARKKSLVEHGFRLPSCMDNRPLKFSESQKRIKQVIYVSATPAEFEKQKSQQTVELLIRPTGLLDPEIEVRPTKNQMQNTLKEIKQRASQSQRVLVTALTKKLAEAIAKHLQESGVKAAYLHSEIKTLQRPVILADLRKGKYDCLVGINLLREGLDLPEVSLVIVLDADKEGFLRNETSLMQVMGRASRHMEGKVIMYADRITGSMRRAIKEVERRRRAQKEYNKKHNIKPEPIKKDIRQWAFAPQEEVSFGSHAKKDLLAEKKRELKYQLELARRNLQFEKAAFLQKQLEKVEKKKL